MVVHYWQFWKKAPGVCDICKEQRYRVYSTTLEIRVAGVEPPDCAAERGHIIDEGYLCRQCIHRRRDALRQALADAKKE